MIKKTASSDARPRPSKRDRLKQEVAFLKAIGATPQRLLGARTDRTVRKHVALNRIESETANVSNIAALRALAKYVRADMQPHLDSARRTLLIQVKALTAQSPTSQVTESLELLEALRCFDPDVEQLAEAATSLHNFIHGKTPRQTTTGGAQRREV